MATSGVPSGPTLPNPDNLSAWRFQDALAAATGETYDQHGSLSAKWFQFSPTPTDTDYIYYKALDKCFFSARLDTAARDRWLSAYNGIDSIMPAVGAGAHGAMNWMTLYDDASSIADYATWLYSTKLDLLKWSDSLTSTDSEFKGKAAYLIQAVLAQKAADFGSLVDQMTLYLAQSTWMTTAQAGAALQHFGQGMNDAWSTYKPLCPDIQHLLDDEAKEIYSYLSRVKLVPGEPGYLGEWNDPYAFWHERATSGQYTSKNPNFTESKISELLKGYSSTLDGHEVSGDLCQPAVWEQINARVTTRLQAGLDALDAAARALLDPLQKQYRETSNTILPLIMPTDGHIVFTPDPPQENNNNAEGVPGNTSEGGPGNNAIGTPGGGSGGTSGGASGHPGSDLNGGGGGLDGAGTGGGLDGGGTGTGIGNGGLGGLGLAAGLGAGLGGLGLGTGLGGLGFGTGSGTRRGGLGLGTGFDAGRRGIPGPGSSIGKDLVEKPPVVPSEELPPLAGEAKAIGKGSAPFYPPSTGGGMGGGGEQRERERLTWLAENENVWGTSIKIGPRVIGRHEPDPDEACEIVLLPGGVLLPIPARGDRRTGHTRTDRRQRRVLSKAADPATSTQLDESTSDLTSIGQVPSVQPAHLDRGPEATTRSRAAAGADEAML